MSNTYENANVARVASNSHILGCSIAWLELSSREDKHASAFPQWAVKLSLRIAIVNESSSVKAATPNFLGRLVGVGRF